jgi:hypothetical protein
MKASSSMKIFVRAGMVHLNDEISYRGHAKLAQISTNKIAAILMALIIWCSS